MLKSLSIENYALIDKLHIDFESGFSVITGETGAGKSIILGALGLVLGQRADGKVIRNEDKKCIIEAAFDISNYHLKEFFVLNELDYESLCVIRREIQASGKSRSFINDTPINVTILKELADQLLDIHSQHQNLLIANKTFQFNVVDAVAHTQELLLQFRLTYDDYRHIQYEIKQLQQTAEKEKSDTDYFQYQYDQLQAAKLQVDEQGTLEKEVEVLTHAEEIKIALAKVDFLLSEENRGIVPALKDANRTLQQILLVFPKIEDVNKRIESCFIELKDLLSELGILQNDLEFDPERFAIVNERLNLIYDLEQKHRVKSVGELIAIEKQLASKLENINSFDERLAQLQTHEEELLGMLKKHAGELSEKRKAVVSEIEQTIRGQLTQLGMPNAKFIVSITQSESFHLNGENDIDFLFSANKNVEPQSISKIASGGEIARVMLCIKALLSDNADVSTIIFDEIDTGVSGDIADKMGNIMKQMGDKMQVISITHLPQIAAKGSVQYKVFKSDKDDRTETQLKRLTHAERVREIAQMLSGSTLTDAAMRNAEVLLGTALF